ncbi:GNAT family N-acetyltransferase [Aureimonas mangrovi]|uniref:GNAT family N-acetyltransferase n=1 Tax=Aureimonas mangrovi TaxID=2758041 RepID=UPI00163D583F|nr:GNAT family N-acetyltransferase [Aureimonas mangrovi]
MKTIAAEIRCAAREDAAALCDVHAQAWRGAYAGIIPHKALNAMIGRRGPDWWRHAIGGGAAVLALDYDGRTVGYATIGHNRTRAIRAEGEIYELYILPDYQGVGFGRHLFEGAGAFLASRGLKGLAVWALEDNDRALAFYRGLAGREVAVGSERFEHVTLSKVAFLWQ